MCVRVCVHVRETAHLHSRDSLDNCGLAVCHMSNGT